MSRTSDGARGAGGDDAPSEGLTREEAEAQVQELADDNYRLRTQLHRERKRRDVRAALGFGGIGGVAAAAGVLLPETRGTLFAIAAIAFFAAVFVAYLGRRPGAAPAVDDGVYTAAVANARALVRELDLQGPPVYTSLEETEATLDDAVPVRLFVPQHPDYALPDAERLASAHLVAGADRTRGVSFVPTGGTLLERFCSERPEPVEGPPLDAARTLADALVDDFELVEEVRLDRSSGGDRIDAAVSGSALGPVDRLDHPVASFLACGLAAMLEGAVVVEATAEVDRADYLLTVRLDPEPELDPDRESE